MAIIGYRRPLPLALLRLMYHDMFYLLLVL